MIGATERAPARRRLRIPLAGTGLWVWPVMGAVCAVCLGLVLLQARQARRADEALRVVRELRNARLDLAKGFLHLAEAGAPGSAFSRTQGLALLRQAAASLEAGKGAAPGVITETQRAAARALRARLATWPEDGMSEPGLAAELRAEFHAVEREADAMDARLGERLREEAAGNRREFLAVTAGAGVLLLLFCGALLVLQRRGARAARATRAAESRFVTVVENLGEGLILADGTGTMLHWNRAAMEMHDFATPEEWRRAQADFLNTYVIETPEGEAVPFERWPLQRLLRGEEVRNVELRLRRPADGWARVFSYGGGMARGADGSGFVFLTIGDTTARNAAERALRELNVELERRVERRTEELAAKNRELEMFTYSVSHDLKAPLRGIDGYSRLLLEDHAERLDEEGRRFLGAVRQASAHMGQLIDDLLAYSRLERRAPMVARVRPRELAGSLLLGLTAAIEERGARVTQALPEDVQVVADPQGLAMALRNLLDNALKFTRTVPEPVIEIGARAGEMTCVLWVRDNGIGFDMRFIDRIFEIFQRLHRTEDYPGTGIGLAIVRKAMERMGGRAWAESAPGRGATFFLEIPLFKP